MGQQQIDFCRERILIIRHGQIVVQGLFDGGFDPGAGLFVLVR